MNKLLPNEIKATGRCKGTMLLNNLVENCVPNSERQDFERIIITLLVGLYAIRISPVL